MMPLSFQEFEAFLDTGAVLELHVVVWDALNSDDPLRNTA